MSFSFFTTKIKIWLKSDGKQCFLSKFSTDDLHRNVSFRKWRNSVQS